MFLTLIMGIFNLFASPDLSYKEFEKWVDSSLNTELPKDVVAFCFNLYDDGNGQWSVELVGTSSFDKDDSDWACNEVFDTRNNPLKWKSKKHVNPNLVRQLNCFPYCLPGVITRVKFNYIFVKTIIPFYYCLYSYSSLY